jgi:hypothetical protein
MRCKSCDYRLWNLRSRTCPECGTAFKPSEFEFALNSVQFCCPHCGQDYYGTGEKGHLRPFEFNCVRCKTRINMDEMVCLPTTGVEEEQTQISAMPWFDERRSGFRRWAGTIRMALIQPGEMMRVTPEGAAISGAWNFFWITNLITIVLASGVICLFPLIGFFAAPGGIGARGASAGILMSMGVALLLGAVGIALGVVLWALATHGLLCLTGKTAHGLRRTQQALLFASGANIVTSIPCLGSYFGWIWWLVSSIVAVKEAQRVSGLRATFAILGFPFVLIAGIIAFYAWVIISFISVAGASSRGGWFPQHSGVTLAMTSAVKSYAAAHNGAGPTHPAELLLSDPTLSPLDFVVTGQTPPEAVSIAGFSLDKFESLDERTQKRAIEATVALVTSSPAPQKFGDFIFVYAGLNLSTCPPDTWIVIHQPAVSGWYDIGIAAGSSIPVAASSFQTMLNAENTRRAALGAPPIPTALFSVTSQPAVSQPTNRPGDVP